MLSRTAALIFIACSVSLPLAGCERGAEEPGPGTAQASAELAWARDALGRNPNLEILATDTATGVFTVRERASGEVRTVKLAEIAAAPVEMLARATSGEPAPAAEPAPATEPALTAEPAMPEGETAADAEPQLDYTVERSGGQVRVTGPGVSIVSAAEPAPASAADTGARAVDPIICEGERVMQINDRRIRVQGDAITARRGCQLHITNSRIVASGTGVVVKDAIVHITNSEIEGTRNSVDAAAGSKVFLQGATMKGALRRDEDAEVQELGNNQWR